MVPITRLNKMADFDNSVNLQISNEQVVREWTEYAIQAFHNSLIKKKVGYVQNGRYRGIRAGDLWNSFEKELRASGGNVDQVIIKFLQYGRYQDMGAGRGYTLGEQVLNRRFDTYRNTEGQTVGRNARRRKPWYSKTYRHQVLRLSEIYEETFGRRLATDVENSLQGSINLNPL